MKVLIFTVPGDVHAAAVDWGLRQCGFHPQKVFLSNIPQRAIFEFDPQSDLGPIYEQGDRTDLHAADRVWFRRLGRPTVGENVHPGDRFFAEQSWLTVRDFICKSYDFSRAFCINPPIDPARLDSKLYHLKHAVNVGLNVPATLVTHDLGRVVSFIEGNLSKGKNTIVKPLLPQVWVDSDNISYAMGTEIVCSDDLEDADLRSSPNIYQEAIDKAYDVRVNVMGRTVISAKLESQTNEESKTDFRLVDDWTKLGCQKVPMPDDVKERVIAFMGGAGAIFGTLDFVVDQQGSWIFLELNEMGNFLWQEICNPELPLLSTFTNFVISGDASYEHEFREPQLRFDQFLESDRDNEFSGQEISNNVSPLAANFVTET